MNRLVPLLGFIGSIGFACSGIPLAYRTFRSKKTVGMPASTIWMLLFSFLSMYSYLLLMYGFDWIVFADYGISTTCWVVIGYYHYAGQWKHKGGW